MVIVGINFSTNSDGEKVATIHCQGEFEPYYRNPEKGRNAIGKRVESIYVGNYDISGLELGNEIEVYFDKARSTAKGTFQPVKKIEVIE